MDEVCLYMIAKSKDGDPGSAVTLESGSVTLVPSHDGGVGSVFTNQRSFGN